MTKTPHSPLLGALTPHDFMRRHWQKRPLLVRQAVPGVQPPLTRPQLFDMAGREGVESRLIVHGQDGWRLHHGPIRRARLPPLRQPRWTLLVQGLDLHVPAARAILDRFRFVPDARLDDLMMSFATDGGGVGPHYDSYDVFLLQTQGQRRWRIGPLRHPQLVPGLPLKILADFQPDEEWLLDPGDMLYLPPGWGHDGVAVGECSTCSIGYRVAGRHEIGHEVLQRVLDASDDDAGPLYRDPRQSATRHPGEIPAALQAFATDAVARLLARPHTLERALGELLSEPKPGVWFDGESEPQDTLSRGVTLDRRSRMLYDARHVYLNGESFRAAGRDARLMRRLADQRRLDAPACAQLSPQAAALVAEWLAAGWLQSDDDPSKEHGC